MAQRMLEEHVEKTWPFSTFSCSGGRDGDREAKGSGTAEHRQGGAGRQAKANDRTTAREDAHGAWPGRREGRAAEARVLNASRPLRFRRRRRPHKVTRRTGPAMRSTFS